MKKLFGSFLGILVFILLLNVVFGGLATEYVVEYWASYARQTRVNVPFLPCVVAGLFLGELTIPLAVITWLLSFAM